MTKPKREFSPEKIDEWQAYLEKKGFQNRDQEAHRTLAIYLANERAAQAEKGVILQGPTGSGKTHWMRLFVGIKNMHAARKLLRLYFRNPEGLDAIVKPMILSQPDRHEGVMAIDDLGTEPRANNYGTTSEVIGDIILDRYDTFKCWGVKTYITTNLTMADIAERYTERITSRLLEMCTVVSMKAPDARVTNETPEFPEPPNGGYIAQYGSLLTPDRNQA